MWFDRSLQFVSSHSKERCKWDWAHRAAHPEVNFHLDINGSAADQQRGLAGIGCSDGPDPDAMANQAVRRLAYCLIDSRVPCRERIG